MKFFAIRNTSQGEYVSDIYRNRAFFTHIFKYARMYHRRADASRLANRLNAEENKSIYSIVEIELTETTPGKRKSKRVSKRAFKRSSKR